MNRLIRLTALAIVWMVPTASEGGQQPGADAPSGTAANAPVLRQAPSAAAQQSLPTPRRRGSMVGLCSQPGNAGSARAWRELYVRPVL